MKLTALMLGYAGADGASAAAAPGAAQACVAAHSFPASHGALMARLPESAARDELRALATEARLREADFQALLVAQSGPEAPPWSETRSQQLSLEAFQRCAAREFPAAQAARVEACAADLYALPVILLFRGEGLSLKQASADLKRSGQLDDGSDYARRAPLMLEYAYQGAGPVAAQMVSWIDQKVAAWTERCLSGSLRFKGQVLTP